jgi:hypothetical protein
LIEAGPLVPTAAGVLLVRHYSLASQEPHLGLSWDDLQYRLLMTFDLMMMMMTCYHSNCCYSMKRSLMNRLRLTCVGDEIELGGKTSMSMRISVLSVMFLVVVQIHSLRPPSKKGLQGRQILIVYAPCCRKK